MLSASFGVGGAVVSTPAIRALGVSALTAVGTTLPSVLPSAISGSLRYGREGLIDWRVVQLTVPVGVAASVGGAFLSRVVPGEGHLLMILTATLLGVSAWRMTRSPRAPLPATAAETDAHHGGDARPRPVALIGVGVVAGLLSGLLGVGGGVIMVPGFTEIGKIPLKVAIATSLVCVGMFAVPGTIAHAYLGGIDWRVALALTIGVVPGARLGASAAMRATDRNLRIAIALFLGMVAAGYFAGELTALLQG